MYDYEENREGKEDTWSTKISTLCAPLHKPWWSTSEVHRDHMESDALARISWLSFSFSFSLSLAFLTFFLDSFPSFNLIHESFGSISFATYVNITYTEMGMRSTPIRIPIHTEYSHPTYLAKPSLWLQYPKLRGSIPSRFRAEHWRRIYPVKYHWCFILCINFTGYRVLSMVDCKCCAGKKEKRKSKAKTPKRKDLGAQTASAAWSMDVCHWYTVIGHKFLHHL